MPSALCVSVRGVPMLEHDFRPVGHYRMPGAGRDGVMRRRGRAVVRAIHQGDDCAVVAAWACGGGHVRIRATGPSHAAAEFAVERMRYALNLDHDLRPFHAEFKRDPLIGPAIRRFPWIRPSRIADPFQALAWAIAEQLIDVERAFAIQRRLTFRYGRRSACGTFVDAPSAAALAGRAPAELQSCDLSAGRSLAMVLCAREVAAGRVDLHDPDHERGWARLLRIREVGPWTIEKLALHGQGRDDMLPAGDLAYIKFVGRHLDLGRRATVDEVRDVFAPYGEYAGLAGSYALAGARLRALPPPAPARTAMSFAAAAGLTG
jgi:3-methyladenine DNA glycosylase/8-oxoguanine DNA glycosylase